MRDGNRRLSRGGQGGLGRGRGRREDARDNYNQHKLSLPNTGRATPTGPMSPPPPRTVSAGPTTVQTPIPTPIPEIPIPVFKSDPAPFDYAFITEDRLAAWDTVGHQEVTQKGREVLGDEDSHDTAFIFLELIRAALDGRLDPVSAGKCVKDILGPDTAPADGSVASFDAPAIFLDNLSMILEADDDTNNVALRSFLVATGVSPVLMRQKLDNKVLQDTGLTRETFNRMSIRQATNQLYRQANYNLLREETEGYSKLITELFTTSAREPPTNEVAEDAFERVKGLIGTFDLDVGRVLDITLDVFAAVLVKHFRFFIKFLRVSSWWPRIGDLKEERHGGLPNWALPNALHQTVLSEEKIKGKETRASRDILFWERAREVGLDAFFELGGRHLLDDETRKRILDSKGTGDKDLDGDHEWIEQTGTLPPSGNRVAAQLLGFKLRFYASAARDDDDVLPPNLIYLTALLIKIGFISLRDLYPHLWPLDEAMPAVREKRAAELAEKERLSRPGGGSTNALANAGALTDDTIPGGGRTREAAPSKSDPTAKVTTETDDKTNEPLDQKAQLLTHLLTIGAIPESLFILGRFPWLPEAYPEIFPLLNRILLHSITEVYDQIRPLPRPDQREDVACPAKKVVEADVSGKGQHRFVELPTRNMLRWPFADKFDANANVSYRFYWDEWADDIPMCRDVDDLFTLCNTFLNFSGVSIGKDPALLSKIARIGNHSLRKDRSQHNIGRWQELLKRLIVPALSLTTANATVANEVYDMLQMYPISVRYSIYAEWFEGATTRLPAMKIAFARAKLETLSTMKRISKINVAPMARALAKIAYASPGIVFNIALAQIEAYSNLTEVVVECAKQFTPLGYDVLVWSLMSSLGTKGRNRNNAEFALLPSPWLLALSRFSGKVYKRYSFMDLSPILRYVTDQIYRGNSTDLVILKELIAQMSGIVPDTDFTDAQILAMTGGEELRKQTLINLQDKRFESTKTSNRLMRALTHTKLAGELLISIAQYRQTAIFKVPDDDAHIKLLATIIDDTQAALSQYLDLLRSNLSVEDFDRFVPGIPELLADFGLQPALAFMIGRPSLSYLRSTVVSSAMNGKIKVLPAVADPETVAIDADGDVGMDGQTVNGVNGDEKSISINGDAAKEDATKTDAQEQTPQIVSADPFSAILEPIIASVQTALPEATFNNITPELYVTFWASTLGDLVLPSASYEAEISRLVSELAEISRDRSDMSRTGVTIKDKRKAVINETRDKLIAEFKSSLNAFGQKKTRLLRNKALWFRATVKPEDASNASEAFLEQCLLPRLLLSHGDAEYCFRIIRFFHDNGVPYFRTLSLYIQIFKPNRLRAMMFTCTVREAENLGRFLKLILTDLSRWHADAAVYEKEAWGTGANLPGFAKALDENGRPKGFVSHEGDATTFKSILFRMHKGLNTALRDCFEGSEWMHIRNAITVLKCVVQVFPAINFQGAKFLELLEGIALREKGVREDLALTGNAVFVQLKKREPKWMMIQAFGHIGQLGQSANDSSNVGHANSKVATKSFLKPTAAEFKPVRASSLGVPTSKIQSSAEVEDGEVDDAKTSIRNASAITKPSTVIDLARTSKRSTPPSAAMEFKKSEILDRREQIKLQQARDQTKAHISTPPHSSAPPRPEPSRNSTPTSLPSRPDAPFPSRELLDRHPRHGDRRDGRDPRLVDSRLDRTRPGERLPERPGDRPVDRTLDRPGDRIGDRTGDRMGDRLREFSGTDRRPGGPVAREFGGLPGPDRERVRLDPLPRWPAEPARETLERSANAREADNGRLSREMPPPRLSGVGSDRGSHTVPDRMPLGSERQELMNPERAALISGDIDTALSSSPRRGREDLIDRTLSRPQSPRRHGADKERVDPRRDDRQLRNGPTDLYNSPRSRLEDVQPPPAGPRSDRPADRERGNPNERLNFQSMQQPLPRNVDPDHGRLNSMSRSLQSDPNFGRLTAASSDIPSGPRDRNSRGGWVGNGPPISRQDGRLRDIPRPPTPEKQQPPTGPSARFQRRSFSGQSDPTPAPGPPVASSPSVATPPATVIHPDRLKHLGGSIAQQTLHSPPLQQVQNPIQAPAGAIHPDRLRAFGNEDSVNSQPQSQANSGRSRPTLPQVLTSGPPSGPKVVQPSPVHTGPHGFAAPTGPASATERAARGGRRQLAGINTMLQQAGQQTTPDRMNARGRGGRISGMGPDTPISGPPTPLIPLPSPTPGSYFRSDSTRDMARDLINPARADLITGPEPPSKDPEEDHYGRRERSGRSRRESRSPGRERDTKRPAPEDERPPRGDYRDRSDRRGTERDSEKDRHQSRSSPVPPRDLMAGRDITGGRDGGREHERGNRDREGGRRDGREREPTRDQIASGWAGERGRDRGNERSSSGRSSRDTRSGDMRSEDQRRESRGSRDEHSGSRKRRSDEGGLEFRGHEKRPRR
ncbi:THO complex subunit 2 [Diplocarpon rosae]|nr:THO complex subunit 2 [Diplocarpon rosae]